MTIVIATMRAHQQEAMLHNQWRKPFCSRLASHVSPEMLQRTTNYRARDRCRGAWLTLPSKKRTIPFRPVGADDQQAMVFPFL